MSEETSQGPPPVVLGVVGGDCHSYPDVNTHGTYFFFGRLRVPLHKRENKHAWLALAIAAKQTTRYKFLSVSAIANANQDCVQPLCRGH